MASKRISVPGGALRQRSEGGVWLFQFTPRLGQHLERSTGTSDVAVAKKRAAEIFAHHVAREPGTRARSRRSGALDVAVAEWLVSTENTHPENTRKQWRTMARAHWLPRWNDVTELTTEALKAYRSDRLGKVKGCTVKKELSAMRGFLRFKEIDIVVPEVDAGMVGKPYARNGKLVKRRSTAPSGLTHELMIKFLAALPEWSEPRNTKPYPVRARFVVQYYTSLRPSTIDRLVLGRHWELGSTTLLVEDAIDKVRFGRELPLPEPALTALTLTEKQRAKRGQDHTEKDQDAAESDQGRPIFGHHDYRAHIAEAAKVLPKGIRSRFCAAHLRSARLTDVLEKTGNLPGAQFMAGHKTVEATNKYVKPTKRAAENMLAALA